METSNILNYKDLGKMRCNELTIDPKNKQKQKHKMLPEPWILESNGRQISVKLQRR